ncbi:MAG: thioredoxin family protein [Psychroflexus halocasei]
MQGFFVLVFLIFSQYVQGQSQVEWIQFQDLQSEIDETPQAVFIFFHADWCVYCKKMELAAFKKAPVINLLNQNFINVKMHAESTDEILFDGQVFKNREVNNRRQSYHEIPLILAERHQDNMTLPFSVILDKNFKIVRRYFRYLSPQEMEKELKEVISVLNDK